MGNEKIFGMYFAKVYPMLLAKAERKGRTKDEVDDVFRASVKTCIMKKGFRREELFLKIRQERPSDYETVYQVVKEAFAAADHSDGNEQNLVVALRKSGSFIPELSLVAACGDKIVGHILFTRAFVGGEEVLALAPLSVLPEYRNRGIGLSLIGQGHRIAAGLGYRYCVVLGHSGYYPKAGYVPASRYGIRAPFAVADENFMAACLGDSVDGKLDGMMEYDKAFGI